MTEVNAITADKHRDIHYRAACGALEMADSPMKAEDRQAIVALANAHIRLVELLTDIGRGRL